MSGVFAHQTGPRLLAAALVALLLSPTYGQSPQPPPYRRVFVPEEALNQYIRGLLPLKREEFERRIALAARQDDSTAAKKTARIEQAIFRARLNGGELTEGEAEIAVIAAANEPTLLALEPCGLTLESAVWPSNQMPAVIGRDLAAKLQCVVEGSGKLEVTWKLAAADASPTMSRFELRLPVAPRRRLEITTAKDVELEVEGGLILDGEVRATASDERLWPIELTGAAEIRLNARKTNVKQPDGGAVIVREETQYNVLPGVVDLETSFTLDVLRQPLRELKLDVDRRLQIKAVRLANQNLPFVAAVAEKDGPQMVSIELPSELSGTDRIVAVEATAPCSTEQAVELPRMKIAGAVLQEGRLEVHAPAWLRLQSRPLRGCFQIDGAAANATRPTDRFVFQAFAADAAIEVAPNQTLAPLREESGTQLNVEATQVTGVLIAELKATGGAARFAVAAELPRQWIVDAVETQPADMLADRTLVPGGQNPQRLQIKLARPLTAQQPLRVIIRGHFRRPPNDQPLGDEFFHLARFPEAHDRRQLVAVRVNDPAAELRLTGSEAAPRLDPTGLTAAELRLFEAAPGTLLLETGSLGQSLQASLRATTARYRADALIRAEIARGRVEQTVTIHCQPETSNVASLVVRITPRPRGEVTWRLAGEEARDIGAVTEDSPASGVGAEDAIYRLLLPRPYSSPFEIVGQWSSHQSGSDELSLVFLPSAIRQTGLVEVVGPGGDIFVRSQELQSVPGLADEHLAGLYGRYRYEAGRRSKLSVEPLPSGIVSERTWIDSVQLTSHGLPDGSAEHELQLNIQNAGGSDLPMYLPGSASECRVVMDGEAEEPLDQIGAENTVLIPLPAERRSVTVHVRYVSKDTILGVWPIGTFRAPVPRFDVPVLAQSWRVMLPPDLMEVGPATARDRPAIREVLSREEAQSATLANLIHDRFKSVIGILAGPALATRWMSAEHRPPLAGEASFAGWNECVLPLPASDEATLRVYRPGVVAAWSYCLALASGAFVVWLGGRSGWSLVLAGSLAGMAVISQPPAAWLLGAASSGVVIGQLWLLARAAPKSNRSVPPHQAVTTTRHYAMEPAAGIFIFLAVVSAAKLATAGPDETLPAGGNRPRVVIPVDEKQLPIGDYVFLEDSLYEQLHRFSAGNSADLPAVLFEKARYELPAAPTARGGAAVEELRATFDFHTFHSEAAVQLPLRREQTLLLEGRARLDGQPATLDWNADGRGLSLTIAEPGKHRLEIALAAATRQTAGASMLSLDVPPAAIAQAMLPASGAGAGTVVSDGANGKLQVQWPISDSTERGAIALEADQLLSWKVRPGSVSLEGRFRLRPVGGPVRELLLEVDPRLRLLPGRNSGPISTVKTEEGPVELLQVELTEPISAPVELRLAWLWPDASGVGTLLLPRVKLKAERLSHDWTVISSEPELELSRLPESMRAPQAVALTAADIAQIWPDASMGDRSMIFASTDAELQAVIVRPVVSTPRAEQRTDWSVSSGLAQAIYTARLAASPLSRYEHRLAMPGNVKVSRVGLMQAGRSASLRWKQASSGLLIVSLLEPPTADQTLTVIADLSLRREQANVPLPAFGLEGVIDDASTLRIYRQGEVELNVRAAADWLPIDQEQIDEYVHGLGRLAAALRRQAPTAAPPRVSRTPNRPRITGKIFTRASEADGDWRGEVHLQLSISRGVVDELRLSVPDEWSEPLEVEPAMEQRLEASQSEARRQLVLRPRRALSGSVEITLRGPLHAGSGGLQAPDVFLVSDFPLERFVLLDRGSVGEEIDWEMTGLLAVGASAVGDLPPAWRGAAGDWFRVVGQRFDAIAKARPAGAAAPRVALADIRCVPKIGRRIVVTAAMMIQPRGARDADFHLPAGSRLVQALVDGLPVPCVPQGLRSWKISAVSDALPYRLTIVYDMCMPSPAAMSDPLRVAPPKLVGMEVQEALWTIDGDQAGPNFGDGRELSFAMNDREHECSLAAAEIARLQALAHLLDAVASAQTVELPRRILADSFLRWKEELTANQHRLQTLQEQKQLAPDMATPMQLALDAAARSEQRLLQAGILSDSEIGETMRPRHRDKPTAGTYYLVPGNAGALNVSWTESQQHSLIPRAATTAGIAAVALLLALVFQFVAARDFFASRGHWGLALLGVAWWILAPFGWLGWFAVFASLGPAVRSVWTRPSNDAGSSIVRWSAGRSK